MQFTAQDAIFIGIQILQVGTEGRRELGSCRVGYLERLKARECEIGGMERVEDHVHIFSGISFRYPVYNAPCVSMGFFTILTFLHCI